MVFHIFLPKRKLSHNSNGNWTVRNHYYTMKINLAPDKSNNVCSLEDGLDFLSSSPNIDLPLEFVFLSLPRSDYFLNFVPFSIHIAFVCKICFVFRALISIWFCRLWTIQEHIGFSFYQLRLKWFLVGTIIFWMRTFHTCVSCPETSHTIIISSYLNEESDICTLFRKVYGQKVIDLLNYKFF